MVRQTFILHSTELNRTTHFSLNEIDTLIRFYFELRDLFQPHMSSETLHNFFISIFKVYSENSLKSLTFGFAREGSEYINVKEFVKGMSVLLRGTLTEKCNFAFEIYKVFKKACLPAEKQVWHAVRDHATKIFATMEKDEIDIASQTLKLKTKHVLAGNMSHLEFADSIHEYPFLLETWFDFWPEVSYLDIFEKLFLRSS